MQGHSRGVGVGTGLHLCRQSTFYFLEKGQIIDGIWKTENLQSHGPLKWIKFRKGTNMNEFPFYVYGWRIFHFVAGSILRLPFQRDLPLNPSFALIRSSISLEGLISLCLFTTFRTSTTSIDHLFPASKNTNPSIPLYKVQNLFFLPTLLAGVLSLSPRASLAHPENATDISGSACLQIPKLHDHL